MKLGTKILCLAALFLSALELKRTADDSRVNLVHFFNGDTLFPAALFQDLFVDGYSWRGWKFSAATDFFPDIGLYFAVRGVAGETAPAMILCSGALLVLLLGSFYLLMRTVTHPDERFSQTTILLGLGALFLLVNARSGFANPFFRLPIILTYHGGSLICGVLDLAAVCYLLRAETWRRPHFAALAGVFVNTALCMASDRLLLIQFVAPICGALLVGLMMKEATLCRAAVVGGLLLAASLLGQRLLRLIQPPWGDQINNYPFELENFAAACRLLWDCWRDQLVTGNLLHWLATGWLTGCFIYVCFRVAARIAGRVVEPRERGLLLLAVHYLAATAACVVGVSASGTIYSPPTVTTCDWTSACRYFLPTLFLPFFMAGFATLTLPERWRKQAAAVVALLVWTAAGIVFAQSRQVERNAERPVWDYRPDYVAGFDEIAKEFDLHDGFAGFWEAKCLTLLSKRQARVHPVLQNPISTVRFVPYHWLSNSEWYFAAPHGGRPRYDFIVVKSFLPSPSANEKELRAVFGEPAAIRKCGEFKVFIYNRPEDEKFAEAARADCHFLRLNWMGKVGERLVFPGHTLPSAVIPLSEPRAAVEGSTPAGILAGGPFLHLDEPGEYRITLVTTGSPRAGRYAIHLINPKKHGWLHPIGEGETPAGSSVETTATFKVERRHLGRALECRVDYSGSGTLSVQSVTVERVR